MDALWAMWLVTAGAGALLAVLRRSTSAGWSFDALLLFLLASLVCDGLAAFGLVEGWRLNPYAISAGFALAAALRNQLWRARGAEATG